MKVLKSRKELSSNWWSFFRQENIGWWLDLTGDIDCPVCGAKCWVRDNPQEYRVEYLCSDPWCAEEEYDCYSDLYGSMSVPWGGV